jgi:hypothetical protein
MILNLDDNKRYSGTLQENIKRLHDNVYARTHADAYVTIMVVYKKKRLPFIVQKKKSLSKTTFYQMCYRVDNWNVELLPIVIDFIDGITSEVGNNAYISNIHDTLEYSEAFLVELSIRLLRILNADTIYVYDSTGVTSSSTRGLSILKTGKTFYMRFGFEMVPSGNVLCSRFKNSSDLKDARNEILRFIRSITIDDVIKEYKKLLALTTKISSRETIVFTIEYSAATFIDKTLAYRKEANVMELFDECTIMLDMLYRNRKHKLLWKLIDEECQAYDLVYKYIINNDRCSPWTVSFKLLGHMLGCIYGLQMKKI